MAAWLKSKAAIMTSDEIAERETAARTAIGGKTAGRRPSVPVSPKAMARAVDDVTRSPWIEVTTDATLFGVGLPSVYRDAREGRFGASRLA